MNDNKQKFLKLEFFMRNIKILTARLEVGITKIAKDMKDIEKSNHVHANQQPKWYVDQRK